MSTAAHAVLRPVLRPPIATGASNTASTRDSSATSPPSPTRYLDRGGQRVAWDVRNPGHSPFVLVPGIGENRGSYRHLASELTEAGFTVYTMDLRGHGQSDAGFSSYTPDDIGDDVVALLDAEDLTDAVLVGNSISGASVSWAAAAAPQRVARVVLLNPFVRDMPADRWMRPLVPLLFANLWGVWVWAQYRKTLFITEPGDHTTAEPKLLEEMREEGRLAALRAMMRASKAPVTARLATVQTPALIIMGDRDPDYPDPQAEGEHVAQLLGGPARVSLMPECGHYPQAEHPVATARLLIGFAAETSHGA